MLRFYDYIITEAYFIYYMDVILKNRFFWIKLSYIFVDFQIFLKTKHFFSETMSNDQLLFGPLRVGVCIRRWYLERYICGIWVFCSRWNKDVIPAQLFFKNQFSDSCVCQMLSMFFLFFFCRFLTGLVSFKIEVSQ